MVSFQAAILLSYTTLFPVKSQSFVRGELSPLTIIIKKRKTREFHECSNDIRGIDIGVNYYVGCLFFVLFFLYIYNNNYSSLFCQ